MNCKHNSMEQEQACIAGNCPLCLREERDRIAAMLPRIDENVKIVVQRLRAAEKERDKLKARVAELEKDKARLDFLVRIKERVCKCMEGFYIAGIKGCYQTANDAIDAAMKGEKE